MAQRPCKDQSLRNVAGLTKLAQALGDVESANLGMVKARAKAKVCLSQTLYLLYIVQYTTTVIVYIKVFMIIILF